MVYFRCKECPLAHECDERNFSTWKPWGYTADDARDRVMAHLEHSGLHKAVEAEMETDRTDEYKELVSNVDIVEEDEPAVSEPKQKKARSAQTIGATPKGIAQPSQSSMDAVVERVVSAINLGAGIGAFPAASAPAPSTAVMQRTGGRCGGATMSFHELSEVGDALNRASRSCGHLQRLCAAAATACAEERTVIDEAKDLVKARIEASGFAWRPSGGG